MKETSRDVSICSHTILEDNMMIVEDLLEDEFKTHAQATTDALTGLSNHRGFTAIAEHSLALCRTTEEFVCRELHKRNAAATSHGDGFCTKKGF